MMGCFVEKCNNRWRIL